MEGDFGRYLQSVAERDVDLLLMEEFHVSPDFVSWFAGELGFARAIFDGAWHSVSDGDGETDILLRVVVEGKRTAILIENKIDAPEQDQQDARYHIRGARSQNAGLYETYVTCICAPSAYLARLSTGSLYDRRISYEAIRGWFAQFKDSRSTWRSRIVTEAIEPGRRGYNRNEDEIKTKFHEDYYHYLLQKHPSLLMARPTPKGFQSTWVVLKMTDIPKGVTINHKIDRRCVDLSFNATSVEDLRAIRSQWPEDILLVTTGKSASLRKIVPDIDLDRPLAEQLVQFEEVMTAAHELSEYRHILTPR